MFTDFEESTTKKKGLYQIAGVRDALNKENIFSVNLLVDAFKKYEETRIIPFYHQAPKDPGEYQRMVEMQLTIDAQKQTKHENFFVARNKEGQYCLYRTDERGLGVLIGRAIALKTERNERELWFKVENY